LFLLWMLLPLTIGVVFSPGLSTVDEITEPP